MNEQKSHQWTRDEYYDQMQKWYDFMRGSMPEGISAESIENAPLSPEQAGDVIWYFESVMGYDTHDLRMTVPRECDKLCSQEMGDDIAICPKCDKTVDYRDWCEDEDCCCWCAATS